MLHLAILARLGSKGTTKRVIIFKFLNPRVSKEAY